MITARRYKCDGSAHARRSAIDDAEIAEVDGAEIESARARLDELKAELLALEQAEARAAIEVSHHALEHHSPRRNCSRWSKRKLA